MITFKSPVQKFNLFNLEAYVKRDDLISRKFSGNKARKLFNTYKFLESNHSIVDTIECYGSMQSNLLYSLSELAKIFKISLRYYVNRPQEFINEHKNSGNLKEAIINGAIIIPLNDTEYLNKKNKILNNLGIQNNTFNVAEGGASSAASEGLYILANEIIDFFNEKKFKNLNVCLPSGTGSTIAFLNQHLYDLGYKDKIKLYSTSIVVKNDILLSDINTFTPKIEEQYLPTLLECSKRYRYGKLNIDLFNIIKKINKDNKNIDFEYIYDPKMFISIQENLELLKDIPFLYIHCGGLNTNNLMLDRYKEKYNIY
jgi:1-aminocyclopropane-1-carboxylate deaminase/D-cysteine desulfhydrase-like pyridoxal-dependent ACC family enzyme